MQSFITTSLINLRAAALNKTDDLINYATDRLNKIAQYFKDNGGLVSVTEYWGREFGYILGGALGKAFGILLIWLGILLSLVLLSAVQLGVMSYQYLQPKLLRLWDKGWSVDMSWLYRASDTPTHQELCDRVTLQPEEKLELAQFLNKIDKTDS